MTFQGFSRINNITGWLVFLIAAFVYLSTMQLSTSLWDCGEYISSAFKMQVVHPPGRPMFLMINRFFTLFATDPTMVAPIVNGVSALSGAFASMFLCWSVVMVSMKIFIKDINNVTGNEAIIALSSGVIGGLAYTFSDTSWFTAVEAEVYAMSAFFISLLIWLSMKWERRAHQRDHFKWLLLIALVLGISIGVHLLGLLLIPGIVMLYYFKKHTYSRLGAVIAFVVSAILIVVIQEGVISGIPNLMTYFDLLFVNSFGLPFWSGALFVYFVIIIGIAFAIYYTHVNQKIIANTAFSALLLIMLGYSTYGTVVVRAYMDPPINMNNPDDVFSFLYYINREQYGRSPLLYGQYFTANMIDQKEGRNIYVKSGDVYDDVGNTVIPVYDPNHMTVFPRMWSNQPHHIDAYRNWMSIPEGRKPTFPENIKFMFSYQIGHMYFRYLAWNYIGRQNDIQGHGEFNYGNWMSGIPLIDNPRIGSQKNLPSYYKDNKARKTFYGIPFILGLLGMYFFFMRNNKYALVCFLFFFMTGAAIMIALNGTPMQPRERDYAFLGSFYAYAIFIGIGVMFIYDLLRKFIADNPSALLAPLACLVLVPINMGVQGWNDHDRSNDFTARDYAINYLESCAPNAILFTSGDNDTYPLWYLQETEGFRSDIRIVNLSLLNTGWYNAQMRVSHLESGGSEGVEFSIPPEKLVSGVRDFIHFYEPPGQTINPNRYFNVQDIVNFIGSDDRRTKVTSNRGDQMDFFFTKKMSFPVDKEKVLANGTVRTEYADRVVDFVEFEIKRNNLQKAHLLTLDLIATNNWRRPVYFAITTGRDAYLNMTQYFQQEGLTYRLVPIKNTAEEMEQQEGRVETNIMYDNIMNKFKWGGAESEESVYLHYVTLRQSMNKRNMFSRLGRALIRENEFEKAVEVADKCMEVLPHRNVPFDVFVIPIIEIYYDANAPEKGKAIAQELLEVFVEELEYYASLKPKFRRQVENEYRRNMSGLHAMERYARLAGQSEFAEEVRSYLELYN